MRPELIPELREIHRLREDFHRAEKRLTLQQKAICRRYCDGDKTLGALLFKEISQGKPQTVEAAWESGAIPILMPAWKEIQASRRYVEKHLVKLAMELPVWPWVESVRGFGALGVGQIVAECGDLSNYATPAKLWMRMGVGMKDGERQRKKRGPEGIAMKYSPRRHSIIWTISDSIVKVGGPYRKVYDERKAYEIEQHPDHRPGYHHARARRYMAKRLLLHLWKEWRRVGANSVDSLDPDA